MTGRISLVTLGVADLERASEFYTALGWERSSASVAGEVTFFRSGTAVLSLWSWSSLAADAQLAPPHSPPDGFGGITLAANFESPEEVDRVLARAAELGATILKPGQATEWGGYHGHFTDLDGHCWEIAHNPGFPLTAEGRIELP